MILLKDLINRRYNDDKQCVGFEYDLAVEGDDGQPATQTFYFTRLGEKCWKVMVVLVKKEIMVITPYDVEFVMPVKSIKLETVAATGLRYIQHLIQQELQHKSMTAYCIGDIVSGM